MADDIKKAAEAAEEPEVKKAKAKKNAEVVEQPGVFVYIGPTIRGAVQESTIISGTLTEIKAQYARLIEKHPQVERLIVPMDSLAVCRRDVKTSGTLLHRKYVELLSAE